MIGTLFALGFIGILIFIMLIALAMLVVAFVKKYVWHHKEKEGLMQMRDHFTSLDKI